MTRREFVVTATATACALPLQGCHRPSKFFNRRVPQEAHEKMGELAHRGITSFAFTPSSGWVMATDEGPYFARNIPDECYDKLGEFVRNGARIHCIAFPPDGGNRWTITTSRGIFARNIPEECYQKMLTFRGQGHEIKHVAFPPSGGNSWVVLTDGPFFARNIDDECYQMMRNLTQGGRRVTRVAFEIPGNGWVVVAQDEFFARRIDDECFQKMRAFDGRGWLLHNVAFSPANNGWSLYSSGKAGSMPADLVRRFESSLPDGSGGTDDIWTRMRAHNVPGCAVAVVLNNQQAWSCGYGFLEKGDSLGATHPESRFQAASLSKPVAAAGVIKLIEDTQGLNVGDDIRPRLNWKLPTRSCLKATNEPTIDLVMQHMSGVIGRGTTNPTNSCAGFTPEGGGFAGYQSGQTIPTLLEILNGTNTNSLPFELTTNPGTTSAYSGQGFVLLQRMIEQVSGQDFADYMAQEIFAPLGMNKSSFEMQVSQAWIDDRQIAAGHTTAGNVITGKRNVYPESAAAGLYTSVEDFARLIVYLNRRWTNATTQGPLSKTSVQTLLSGRGFFVNGNSSQPDFSYGHGGANAGFRCTITGYPNIGAGYSIMTNGDDDGLLNEATQALKSVYGWS